VRNFRDRHRHPGGPLAARRAGGAPLPYANGVALTGSAGSYIRTADRAELDFSTDIEVVMRLKVTDWTKTAAQTLVGRYFTATNDRLWRFYVAANTGAVGLSASTDGTSANLRTVVVTPSAAFADNVMGWLRMRLDLTNGSNSVGSVDIADDAGNNIEPSSWTANGTNTGNTISGVHTGTAALEIGAFNNDGAERLAGVVARCIVRSGFDGTVVADFNSELAGPTGYTDAYGNAWAIN